MADLKNYSNHGNFSFIFNNCVGFEPWALQSSRMEGTDESIELWQPALFRRHCSANNSTKVFVNLI